MGRYLTLSDWVAIRGTAGVIQGRDKLRFGTIGHITKFTLEIRITIDRFLAAFKLLQKIPRLIRLFFNRSVALLTVRYIL